MVMFALCRAFSGSLEVLRTTVLLLNGQLVIDQVVEVTINRVFASKKPYSLHVGRTITPT